MGVALSLLLTYPDSRVVETSKGSIVGRRLIFHGEKQCDAYQGIPYAKPPIGELRFEKPVPLDPWTGVKDAKCFGYRAMQQRGRLDQLLRGKVSEDCLTLNVFAPAWDAPPGGFPIMVFIHGGAFQIGQASSLGDTCICTSLVQRGIIMITIQYRVGYLGFFYTGDEACTPNLALWDQIAALRWIQEEIGAFGGDKNNVTLMGQSAGGVCTDLLHLSPVARDLFHRIVAMAGNSYSSWATSPLMKEQCEGKARSLELEWSETKELMSKLRALPAVRLATNMFGSGKIKGQESEIAPVLDGELFPLPLSELRASAPHLPSILGVTHAEALVFMHSVPATVEYLEGAVAMAVHDWADNVEEERRAFESLYIDRGAHTEPLSLYRATVEIRSDIINTASAQFAHELRAIRGENAPIYLYDMAHVNPKAFGPFRNMLKFHAASHCTEQCYVFGKGFLFDFDFEADDFKMLDLFGGALVNFIKSGNPNGPDAIDGLPEWQSVSEEHPERSMVFELPTPRMEKDFFAGRPSRILRYRKEAEAKGANPRELAWSTMR